MIEKMLYNSVLSCVKLYYCNLELINAWFELEMV